MSARCSKGFKAIFCDRFRQAMDSDPFTLREWCDLHGYPLGTIHKIRNGYSCPGLERAAELADACRVHLDWLAGLSEDPGRDVARDESLPSARTEAMGL